MIKYSFVQKFSDATSAVRVVNHAKIWKFPGGEVGAALLPAPRACIVRLEITAECKNSDQFMQLIMFLDAVSRAHPGIPVNLALPYLPYARQDRVCNEGESLSIAVIARIINSFKLNKLILVDVHSDVSLALFDNVEHVTQAEVWADLLVSHNIEVLIAPDAGAAKKVYDVAKAMRRDVEVFIAHKQRDLKTGYIISTKLDGLDNHKNKKCAIIDDICDGGRTFTELASIIRHKCGSLNLYVTHGIFSKGEDVVCNSFDEVYTTGSFASKDDLRRVKIALTY